MVLSQYHHSDNVWILFFFCRHWMMQIILLLENPDFKFFWFKLYVFVFFMRAEETVLIYSALVGTLCSNSFPLVYRSALLWLKLKLHAVLQCVQRFKLSGLYFYLLYLCRLWFLNCPSIQIIFWQHLNISIVVGKCTVGGEPRIKLWGKLSSIYCVF